MRTMSAQIQLVFTHPLAKNRARHTVLRNTLSDTAKKVSHKICKARKKVQLTRQPEELQPQWLPRYP